MSTTVASASREFSRSSLTMLTGRWMTSPAAMRATTEGGRGWILRGLGGGGGVVVGFGDCCG